MTRHGTNRFVLAMALLFPMGCAGEGPRSNGGEEPTLAPEAMPRSEALPLVRAFIDADPALSQHDWLGDDPFHVGTWEGYVRRCDDAGLVHLIGLDRDESPCTIVAYRLPFTPAGGGREDFFLIDPDTKRVQHIQGLVGR